MSTTSTIRTEFAIYLADRPGELAGLLEAAEAAGVSIDAISILEHSGRGCIRILPSSEQVFRSLCEDLVETGAGPVVETLVLVIDLPHGPGPLRDIATRLAMAGHNVHYAYCAATGNGAPGACVFRVDDPEGARTTLSAQA